MVLDGVRMKRYTAYINRVKELEAENEQLKKQVSKVEALQILRELQAENEDLKLLLRYANSIIHNNTVPECRRNWENQKRKVFSDETN